MKNNENGFISLFFMCFPGVLGVEDPQGLNVNYHV